MKRKPWAKSLAVHLSLAFALAIWGLWKTRPVLQGQSIEVTIADVHVHHPAPSKPVKTQKSVVMTQSSQKAIESEASQSEAAQSAGSPEMSAGQRDAYLAELMTLISRYQFYPRSAVLNEQEGVVRLRVVIAPDGALQSVELIQSSGSGILDDAAVVALKRVPVFPVPAQRKEAMTLVVPIRYELNPSH